MHMSLRQRTPENADASVFSVSSICLSLSQASCINIAVLARSLSIPAETEAIIESSCQVSRRRSDAFFYLCPTSRLALRSRVSHRADYSRSRFRMFLVNALLAPTAPALYSHCKSFWLLDGQGNSGPCKGLRSNERKLRLLCRGCGCPRSQTGQN